MHLKYILVILSVFNSNYNLVFSWGGVFNRFSPEILSNAGYGSIGGHGNSAMKNGQFYDENDLNGNLLEENSHSCYGKKCSANEFCCPDYVCIDVEGSDVGRCFMAYGKHAGEICYRDSDCESGLVCRETDTGHVCSAPIHDVKLYGESCHMSSECDISNGLCCQLQRRHRQAPRKVCAYFRDPLICIGPVAFDQIKKWVEYTLGEKRLVDSNTF